ncbi:MAG TPA: aminopeptidase P family protein [Coriobacteriia bacterium]
MSAESRLHAFRRRLEDEEIGAALVTQVANMRYLTGFDRVFDDGINAACLVTLDEAWFYTDFRYAEAAEAAAVGTPWSVHLQKESLYIELCKELHAAGVDSLVMEESAPYGRFKFISEQFQGNVQVVESWVEDLRQVKEPVEIVAIEAAARLADEAFEHIVGFVRAGIREIDVALELEFFMRKNGSEGVAFDAIVASGPNSARPHAGVTTRRIEPNDFLKMDFGARVDGYCSDLTRTIVVGTADDRQREVYEAVLAANEAALAGLRPGMPGAEVDAIARRVLTDRGFGEQFGHGLGHGVGLAVHEMPALGPRSRQPVREGAVVTIEPGVYLPGFGGVRIEDLVLVTGDGATLLSHAPKGLTEV